MSEYTSHKTWFKRPKTELQTAQICLLKVLDVQDLGQIQKETKSANMARNELVGHFKVHIPKKLWKKIKSILKKVPKKSDINPIVFYNKKLKINPHAVGRNSCVSFCMNNFLEDTYQPKCSKMSTTFTFNFNFTKY